MKRPPTAIAIALSAMALTALAACETTDGAGQTAQSSETIQWDTPRPAEPPPAATEHKPAYQPPEPECREYQTTIIIAGKPEKAYGRACRQPDGTWKQVGVHKPTPEAAPSSVEQTYPYGWHGYEYPYGPLYGPGGLSVGVGAGSGSGGGFIGTGIGVGF